MSFVKKYYFTSDLPREYLWKASIRIYYHSTTLIKVVPPPDTQKKSGLIGSGTFISIGSELFGILTAQHVMKELDIDCHLGIQLVEEETSPRIPVRDLDLVELASPPFPGGSPDLAFIGISQERANAIKSYGWKAFYDLSINREEMITKPPDRESSVWFVVGTPREFTKTEFDSHTFERVISLESICGAGGAEPPTYDGQFDYIESIVEYDEEYDLPSSLLGISGGGLWQATIKPGSGDLQLDRYLFVGMPFAVTAEIKDGKAKILCHGPRSIYDYVYNSLKM